MKTEASVHQGACLAYMPIPSGLPCVVGQAPMGILGVGGSLLGTPGPAVLTLYLSTVESVT